MPTSVHSLIFTDLLPLPGRGAMKRKGGRTENGRLGWWRSTELQGREAAFDTPSQGPKYLGSVLLIALLLSSTFRSLELLEDRWNVYHLTNGSRRVNFASKLLACMVSFVRPSPHSAKEEEILQ